MKHASAWLWLLLGPAVCVGQKLIQPPSLGTDPAKQEPSAKSEVPNNMLTRGKINGRYWRAMSKQEHVAWMIGYSEGMAWASDLFRQVLLPKGLIVAEAVDEFDALYADSVNRVIPLRHIGACLAAKETGGFPAQEKCLVEQRSYWASLELGGS